MIQSLIDRLNAPAGDFVTLSHEQAHQCREVLEMFDWLSSTKGLFSLQQHRLVEGKDYNLYRGVLGEVIRASSLPELIELARADDAEKAAKHRKDITNDSTPS